MTNDMYKYEYLVDRILQDNPYWHELLNMCKLDEYGRDQQGLGFENDTFAIRPYNWDNEKDPLPNFEYKPVGFMMEWYKYPFRASYMNMECTVSDVERIFGLCKISLYVK